MIPPKSATDTDAIREARLRAQQIARDFESVFGQPAKRTAPQKNVLEHLALCAGDDANSYRFHEAKDGLALVAAGIHRDGAKTILRIIDRQISIAANAAKPKKEKPAIKRK